jgi:hypothetical protein
MQVAWSIHHTILLAKFIIEKKIIQKDETATYDYHWKCIENRVGGLERDNEIMKPSALHGWGRESTSLEFGLWSEIHQKIIVSYFI